ncbi:proline-rich protein 23B-like [Ursus americanus]|uniref:proline-rich protein 23B-like n=1 Tax=Ursus americanus TaxID=9643 RepID=UPI001E679593|nr:proline-rich protein 23B-like [Ursus americanus]
MELGFRLILGKSKEVVAELLPDDMRPGLAHSSFQWESVVCVSVIGFLLRGYTSQSEPPIHDSTDPINPQHMPPSWPAGVSLSDKINPFIAVILISPSFPVDLHARLGLKTPTSKFFSVVVLATGCALQLLLDDVELVLEPQATSALQVTLGELSLVLVPEALLSSGGQGPSPAGLEHGAFRNAPGHQVAVEQGFFCASVPEVAAQEEAYEEDADPEFLPPGLDPAAGSVPGLRPHPQGPKPDPWPGAPTPRPKRRSPLRYFSLDAHLLEPFPSSPLQPLPPSPSPGPQVEFLVLSYSNFL